MNFIVKINDGEIEFVKLTDEVVEEMGLEWTNIPSELIRASNLIKKYHFNKDKEPLARAIRDNLPILDSEVMREFLASIVEGSYKPLKKGYMLKNTEEKQRLAFAKFMYYRSMGLPIDDDSGFSCIALAAKDSNISEFYLLTEILAKRRLEDVFYLWTPLTDGEIIKILNSGKPPNSLEKIRELENYKDNLSQDDEMAIWSYYLYSTFDAETRERMDNDGKITTLESKIREKYSIR